MKLSKITTSENQEVSINITTRNFLRLALLSILCVTLVQSVHKASHSLLLIAIAFFMALALNAPVHWVSSHLPGKRKGSRTMATAIAFFVVIACLGAFLASVVPPLVKQTDSFARAAPSLVMDFRDQDSSTGRLIRKYHLEKQVDEVSKDLTVRIKNSSGKSFSTILSVGTSLFSLVAMTVLTFMMLVEGPKWLEFMYSTFPKAKRAKAKRLSSEMYSVVKGFVNGQVLLAALAAVLILPALLVLGIGYPVALVVVIFTCGLIPLVGHTIGASIVTIVALFQSPTAALIILAYYILYQQLENYLIQPRVQANATNMSPLLILMAVIIGVSFGGVFAGLFAIPLAGVLRILVLEQLRSNNVIDDAVFEEVTHEAK